MGRLATAAFVCAALATACGVESAPTWSVSHQHDDGALLSVWGSGPDDVWAVGGQVDRALMLHNDGERWSTVDIEADRLLSWTYGFRPDDVYAVGERGLILHYDGERWAEVASGTDKHLYGLWGSSGHDVWIVGGNPAGAPGDAVILHGDGDSFEIVDVPPELLPGALYKAYGSPNGLVAVGTRGTVLRFDGTTWSRDPVPTEQPLFSLWGRDGDVYAVGGFGVGELLRYDGSAWSTVYEDGARGLSGIYTEPGEPIIAVGTNAFVLELDLDGNVTTPAMPELLPTPWLHSVWGDGDGTTWAVGGDLYAYSSGMTGVILKRQ